LQHQFVFAALQMPGAADDTEDLTPRPHNVVTEFRGLRLWLWEREVCRPVKMGCFALSETPPANSFELRRPPTWSLQKKQELFVINGVTARSTAKPSSCVSQHGYGYRNYNHWTW